MIDLEKKAKCNFCCGCFSWLELCPHRERARNYLLFRIACSKIWIMNSYFSLVAWVLFSACVRRSKETSWRFFFSVPTKFSWKKNEFWVEWINETKAARHFHSTAIKVWLARQWHGKVFLLTSTINFHIGKLARPSCDELFYCSVPIKSYQSFMGSQSVYVLSFQPPDSIGTS